MKINFFADINENHIDTQYIQIISNLDHYWPDKSDFCLFSDDFISILDWIYNNEDKFWNFHNFWTTYRKNMYDPSN